MTTVIEYLESFNRKERFFLVGAALGNPGFRLGQDFRTSLSEAFEVQIPPDAFMAMDYHLDWIHASLYLPGREDDAVHRNTERVATGTQEDVDLLVAFEEEGVTHLMLLEAKAETGWTNKQMLSKASRLEQIFGDDGKNYGLVRPHFGLISPRRPQGLKACKWPTWMAQDGTFVWLSLFVPPGRKQITRCGKNGQQSAAGEFFRVSL